MPAVGVNAQAVAIRQNPSGDVVGRGGGLRAVSVGSSDGPPKAVATTAELL
jgi:hypothetical protein